MVKFDDIRKKNNIKDHNTNWPQIPEHSCRILITSGFGSRKTNSLFNLKDHQPDIDKNLFIC